MPKTAAPLDPDRRLRVLSHVLETCVELHSVTSQSRASPSSCEGQRLFSVPAAHTMRRKPARRHVPGRGSCNCGAPESALEGDVQNPLDLLHTQRLAQKAVLRLDVRLGRPRRKLRFLYAAPKDLDGQQVCTIGDHAEEAAQVPSTIEQKHEGLSGKIGPPCAHGSRTVRPTSSGI